jgi:hypothetical protein
VSDLLQKALEKAAGLPPEEQDRIAHLLLAAIRDEADFDRTLTSSESRRPFPTLAEQARDGYGPGAGSDAGAGTDRHTLSDFHRNARNRIEHLRKTGRPEILTVDGRAELVVQHAEAYQRLLDLVANAGAIIGTERGLQGMYEGTGEDADEAFAALERELGLPERE